MVPGNSTKAMDLKGTAQVHTPSDIPGTWGVAGECHSSAEITLGLVI